MKLTKQQRQENAERSERGAQALGAYKIKLGNMDDDDHTVLTDMLADLMHLAHSQRDAEVGPLDWDDALSMAVEHFEAERGGQ